MRFIYKLLIGLILFQGLTVLFTASYAGVSIFPATGYDPSTINVTEQYGGYTLDRGPIALMGMIFPASALAAMGAIGATSLILGLLAKSIVPLGAGAFVAIITGLYIGASGILFNIDPTNNPIISGLITIVGIVIGIIVVFSVAEMFVGQSGADT